MNKKKKILFVLTRMSVGGPQISLINLLNSIDKDKYNITLILFRTGGLLLSEVPDYVKIRYIRPKGIFSHFTDNRLNFLLWLPFRLVIELYIILFDKVFKKGTEIRWNIKKHFVKKLNEKYDVAIGYMEGNSIYYVVDKVRSEIKIGRMPTDYKTAGLNSKFDDYYYRKLDYIFVVSSKNAEILASIFPYLKERIVVFESIISPKIVQKRAKQNSGFSDSFDGIRIFTMARITEKKGIKLAIDSCAILKEKGYNIRWYFMGSGDKDYYQNYIDDKEISDSFYFLNPTVNPFSYLEQSDIYVQPSYFEGKSNAVNEAKALNRPIVITNFSTATDHITHNLDGLISDINPEKLASSIKLLLDDENLRYKFINRLKNTFWGNEREVIELFYKIIDES